MHFDALTLAAVAAELNTTIRGGRVQQILRPDAHSLGMEIYAEHQRHYLLLSAHPQASRVHLSEQKLRRGMEKDTPLLLLLKKYVRGAILDAIELPVAYERLLALRFEHPEHGSTTLLAEPMGRLSNLILLDAGGRILDVLKRIPPGENAQRVLLPKWVYSYPPAQDKVPPLDDGQPDYYTRLAGVLGAGGRLWRALADGVEGISPTLAREIAWRVTGEADGEANGDAQPGQLLALAAAVQELWQLPQTAGWTPGLALDEEEGVNGFAPYELHFVDDFLPVEGISAAIARFYGEAERDAAGSTDAYAGMRNGVATLIRQAEERVRRQLAALTADEPETGDPAHLRRQAEWLLALNSQVQKGQRELVVPLGDEKLVIRLSADETPVQQAERMFDRAAKLERAAVIIPERRARLETDLLYLDQLQSDLALAQNQPEIASVREALREAGYLRQRPGRQLKIAPDRSQPLRYLSAEGFAIVVGRNARQNEIVTFDEAGLDDLWLHVRDAPGSHVVIRSGGQPVREETMRAAAQLAAYYSRLRGERGVAVAMTRRRFVSRAPGGRPGLVHLRNEETLLVEGVLPGLAEG
ncbi:MAG: fibronectin/fibrinogen-binding protein [Chloroflexi bacterium]|nr:MAG: fibronectin/fibrinogen-binding protein [Chloroflexota bacterium]